MESKKKTLTEILGQGSVFDDPETLKAFSRDESFSLSIRPSFVVKPEDGARVQELVRWANRTRTPLVPVSSGPPRFRGDTVPGAADAVVVDLGRMNRILRVNRRNRMAVVEPGVTFSEIQPALRREGLRLTTPLLPRGNKSVVASLLEREPVLVPGIQWSFLEPLRCLEVVWGDGNRLMTGEAGNAGTLEADWKRNSAQAAPSGPAQANFNRFVSAAQGTMGIATWASIKCEVLPSIHRLFFVPSSRMEGLIDFAYRLLRLRFGDEILFLNGLNMAAMLESDPTRIRALAERLPRWALAVGVAGRDMLPRERVEFQEKDISEIAQRFGLQLVPAVPGAGGDALLQVLLNPSREPFWKLAIKGGFQDIFFLTTLERTPGFIRTMISEAEAFGYPTSEVGVYIQPLHQGVCCHCEFTLPFDPEVPAEVKKVRGLYESASRRLLAEGAFFSRPYGIWADLAFNRDAGTTAVLKKIKKIFDPHHVMNPGKLCFQGGEGSGS